jgi:adenylylsulfate kinase
MEQDGWAIWITGLPGSGKSTIAKEMKKLLRKKGIDVQILRLDEFRRTLAPKPRYTEEERDVVYNTLILMAKFLAKNGVNVIIDATAHRNKWRNKGKEEIKNFFEVYVECPLKECMEREANRKDDLVVSNLYKKALQRLERREKIDEKEISHKECGEQLSPLGQMVGIDVPYEKPSAPDVTIKSVEVDANSAATVIIKKMKGRKYI